MLMTALNPTSTPGAPRIEAGSTAPDSCVTKPKPATENVSPPASPLLDGFPEDTSGFASGKQLGIVVSSGSSRHLVEHVKRRFESLGASAQLIVPADCERVFDDRTEIEATHTLEEKPSTDFDFIVVLPGLETSATLGIEITKWAHPLKDQAKPIAIGAQAAERLGVDIDNACIFDVSTCDAFVQICMSDSVARASRPR